MDAGLPAAVAAEPVPRIDHGVEVEAETEAETEAEVAAGSAAEARTGPEPGASRERAH